MIIKKAVLYHYSHIMKPLLEALMKPMTIIVIGASITIVGGIVTAIGTYLQNKSSSERNNRIETGVNEGNKIGRGTSADVISLTHQLSKAYENLDGANSEIKNLQNQLKNEITGGDSKPILKIYITPLMAHDQPNIKYSIVFFDVENHSDYSIHNLKATVSDFGGYWTLTHGIKHFRTELGSGSGLPSQDEIRNYSPEKQFNDIGSLAKNAKHPLYTTTYSPDLSGSNKFNYVVKLKWYNGTFTYYIHLAINDNKAEIEEIELVYNGVKINHKDHFILE